MIYSAHISISPCHVSIQQHAHGTRHGGLLGAGPGPYCMGHGCLPLPLPLVFAQHASCPDVPCPCLLPASASELELFGCQLVANTATATNQLAGSHSHGPRSLQRCQSRSRSLPRQPLATRAGASMAQFPVRWAQGAWLWHEGWEESRDYICCRPSLRDYLRAKYLPIRLFSCRHIAVDANDH